MLTTTMRVTNVSLGNEEIGACTKEINAFISEVETRGIDDVLVAKKGHHPCRVF